MGWEKIVDFLVFFILKKKKVSSKRNGALEVWYQGELRYVNDISVVE